MKTMKLIYTFIKLVLLKPLYLALIDFFKGIGTLFVSFIMFIWYGFWILLSCFLLYRISCWAFFG